MPSARSSAVEALLDVLYAERVKLADQIATVESLLDETPTKQSPQASSTTSPPKPPAPKPPTPAKVASFSCPDCGQTFPNPQGVGAHRRHKHPGSAAKPVAPTEPAAATTPTGKRYACGICSHIEPDLNLLTKHVWRAHKRNWLTDAEKIALAA
jgi:hypothetical protein